MTTMLISTKYFQTSQPCIVMCLFCVMYIVHYRFWSYVKKISLDTCYLPISCHVITFTKNEIILCHCHCHFINYHSSVVHDNPWWRHFCMFLDTVSGSCDCTARPRPRPGVIASLSPPLRYWVTGDHYLLQSISTISTQYLHAESCEHSPVQWISM